MHHKTLILVEEVESGLLDGRPLGIRVPQVKLVLALRDPPLSFMPFVAVEDDFTILIRVRPFF